MTEAGLPRPAATVVLLRAAPGGPEVLLTRRPSTMAFGPGLHVFPGGAVDPPDRDPRLLGRLRVQPGLPVPGSHAGMFMVAAIRELFEEAGILLATGPGGPPPRALGIAFVDLVLDGDLELRGDWLVPLSRWVTPPVVPRRYDARFFVTRLPPGAVPAFDGREVAGHEWTTPRDALAAMAAGRIELWTPTSTTLQQLASARDLDDVRRHCSPRVVPDAAGKATGGEPDPTPCVDHPHPLVTRVHLGGAGGIPGQGVDAFLVGRDRVVVVDPGDPNDEAATAILGAAAERGSRIVGILLTAPVPDHAAGAEGLALRLGVPVHAGSGRIGCWSATSHRWPMAKWSSWPIRRSGSMRRREPTLTTLRSRSMPRAWCWWATSRGPDRRARSRNRSVGRPWRGHGRAFARFPAGCAWPRTATIPAAGPGRAFRRRSRRPCPERPS